MSNNRLPSMRRRNYDQRERNLLGAFRLSILNLMLLGLFAQSCTDEGVQLKREPVIVVSTDVLDFGEVPKGSSETRSIMITNPGNVELVISEVKLKPSDARFVASVQKLRPGQAIDPKRTPKPTCNGSMAS